MDCGQKKKRTEGEVKKDRWKVRANVQVRNVSIWFAARPFSCVYKDFAIVKFDLSRSRLVILWKLLRLLLLHLFLLFTSGVLFWHPPRFASPKGLSLSLSLFVLDACRTCLKEDVIDVSKVLEIEPSVSLFLLTFFLLFFFRNERNAPTRPFYKPTPKIKVTGNDVGSLNSPDWRVSSEIGGAIKRSFHDLEFRLFLFITRLVSSNRGIQSISIPFFLDPFTYN